MTSGYAAMNLKICFHTVSTAKSTVEDSGFLGYDIVSLGERFPVFQRNIVLPSSITKSKFFWDLFTFEDKDTIFLLRVRQYSPNDTPAHLRSPDSSSTQPRERQISYCCLLCLCLHYTLIFVECP